jgi:hypothetical protein
VNFIKSFLLRLLYFTPFGYLLSSVLLLSGDRIKGLKVNLSRYSPIRAEVKVKPNANMRINWFFNAIILFIQSFYVLSNNIAGDIGGGYALLAIIFGGISMVSAIYPKVIWNKNIFR